jgi:hypothetical protein
MEDLLLLVAGKFFFVACKCVEEERSGQGHELGLCLSCANGCVVGFPFTFMVI